jgi:toxin-antitoxin system PIN domain toxin
VSTLLDANLLIALNVGDHVHYPAAVAWFARYGGRFATCPTTEGAVVRHLLRSKRTSADAHRLVVMMRESPRYEFWPDDVAFADVPLDGVIGHRQVTDAYLAELTRRHGGRLATFDNGLAAIHSDVADLVPTGAV